MEDIKSFEELRDKYIKGDMMLDWQGFSPKERFTFFLIFEEFFTPKRQRTSINQNDQELPDDIYHD